MDSGLSPSLSIDVFWYVKKEWILFNCSRLKWDCWNLAFSEYFYSNYFSNWLNVRKVFCKLKSFIMENKIVSYFKLLLEYFVSFAIETTSSSGHWEGCECVSMEGYLKEILYAYSKKSNWTSFSATYISCFFLGWAALFHCLDCRRIDSIQYK